MPEPQLLKDAGNVIKHVAKLALPFLGFMQEGGPVTESGLYHLEEGEHVLPNPGGVVPGNAASTPPMFPSPSQAAAPTDDTTKRLLYALTQAATQRRAAGTPHPVSVPGGMNPVPPASLTEGMGKPQANAQRFMYGIQANIRNGVARMKEQQVAKATADWEYAQSALNEYYAAQQSQDPQAMKAAQVKLDAAFGDPKKLKQMAKALNQDWLNPEKTTVYGDALKRVAAKTQQTEQQKEQAKQGIKGIFQKLIQKSQQPQLTDDEKKKMQQEVINKAPTTVGIADIKQVNDVANLERSLAQAREKYQYLPAADGTVWAVNKSDPKDAHQLRDADTGEAVKGKTAAKEGQVYMANGMPMGVFHNGKPVMPGDAEWKPEDQKMFDAAVTGAKEKQFLRVDPVIAAMIGDPPNPTDYKGGRSDPAYGKALATWGQAAFQRQLDKAAASGEARAKAFNATRGVDIMDDQGNVYYTTMARAIEQGFTGAGEGIKLKSRQAQIGDIETASGREREAIEAVDKPFTASQIAKLKLAMTTDDPGIASTELKALASEELTDKQQDFVIWTNQLNERAMSLRGVAGIGASAQDVRGAIHAMLPGIGSGNTQMMTKQLDAFDQQVKVLKSGIAKPGKGGGASEETTKFTDGGKTYNIPNDKVSAFKKDHPNAR